MKINDAKNCSRNGAALQHGGAAPPFSYLAPLRLLLRLTETREDLGVDRAYLTILQWKGNSFLVLEDADNHRLTVRADDAVDVGAEAPAFLHDLERAVWADFIGQGVFSGCERVAAQLGLLAERQRSLLCRITLHLEAIAAVEVQRDPPGLRGYLTIEGVARALRVFTGHGHRRRVVRAADGSASPVKALGGQPAGPVRTADVHRESSPGARFELLRKGFVVQYALLHCLAGVIEQCGEVHNVEGLVDIVRRAPLATTEDDVGKVVLVGAREHEPIAIARDRATRAFGG